MRGQGGWWCCCGQDCTLWDDDFNRSDNTDLGSGWTEITGDSEIISGELSMPTPGLVIHPIATGDSRPWMRAQADCIDLQPDKKYRVVVNYSDSHPVDVEVDYYAAELYCSGVSAGYGVYKSYLRAISYHDGVTTVLHEKELTYSPGDTASLAACRTLEGLYAYSDPSTVAWDCVEDNDGRKVGLANDSDSLTIEFDDFVSLRGEGLNGLGPDPNQVSRCFCCECECRGHCIPKELTLTFEATGFCSCLNGETITLTLQDADYLFWQGSKTIDSIYCFTTQDVTVDLICQTGSGCLSDPDITLTIDGEIAATNESPFSVSCEPLEMVYGPWSFVITPPCPDDECDCEIYAVITK